MKVNFLDWANLAINPGSQKWYSCMVFIFTRTYFIAMQKIPVAVITSAVIAVMLLATPGIIASYQIAFGIAWGSCKYV
jgi:hypothetical protein